MFNRMSCLLPNGLDREVDRVINQFVGGIPQWAGMAATPSIPLNVWEDEQTIWAEAELPGVAIEDIDLSVRGNELTIQGKSKSEENNIKYLRKERGRSSFTRTVSLGVDVDAERVTASLNNGVLLVTMPKAESAKPRKVEIRTGQ